MGLDMYMTGEKYFVQDYGKKVPDASLIDENEGRPLDTEGEHMESANYRLGYWRKFAPLHRFIVNEFANGEDDCRRIGLGRDDLIKIAEAIEGNKLPSDDDCHGFFFGSPEIWAEYRAEAKEHAAQFRAAATWCEAAPKYESGSPMQWRSVHYQASW
jgi:hypothetical protein